MKCKIVIVAFLSVWTCVYAVDPVILKETQKLANLRAQVQLDQDQIEQDQIDRSQLTQILSRARAENPQLHVPVFFRGNVDTLIRQARLRTALVRLEREVTSLAQSLVVLYFFAIGIAYLTTRIIL